MGLLLSHPEIAHRSCAECQRWLYDSETGRQTRRRQRDPETGEERLLPVVRPTGTAPPCWKCPKCDGRDERTPATGRISELSAKNWAAIRFYYEHQATGGRVDAMARKNCGIIHWAIEQHRLDLQRTANELLLIALRRR